LENGNEQHTRIAPPTASDRTLLHIGERGTETRKKYNHRVEPLAVSHRDGKITVKGRVSGNFPGSPIVLDHSFAIVGDRIVSLEIR
jgi:hypothetical protein